MARAIWSGTLSFGLVSIPVKLYTATSPRDVRFHQFERDSGRRIRLQRVAAGGESAAVSARERPEPEETSQNRSVPEASGGNEPARTVEAPTPATGSNAPVAYQDVVKGYEVDRDRYVMVTPEELRALEPERSRAIEIEDFVDLAQIDPVYFEKSYYVAPSRGVGAEKPYALLLGALEESGKAGIARFVLRSKQYLAAIRAMEAVIGLETMYFADEVRPVSEIDNVPGGVDVAERELQMATQLIDLLVTEWDPARYPDAYRESVLDLIESKRGVITVAQEEEPAEPARVADLMLALKASLEAVKKGSETKTRADGPDAAAPSGVSGRQARRRRTG